MISKYLMLWLMAVVPAIALAQPASSDSLRLAAQSQDPATRLNALASLSETYRNLHPDTTFAYAHQVITSPDTAACPRCVMRAYNMLGTVALNKGNYQEAIEHYYHARDIARSMSILKAEAAILNNISIIYTRQGNYKKAIDNLQMSLYVKVLLGDSLGVAASSLNIGAIYADTKRPELARPCYERAERIYRSSDYQYELATALNNIGMTYEQEKVYDKALPFYMEALKLRRDLKDSVNLYQSFSAIADVFIRKQQPAKALEYVTQGVQITGQYGMNGELAALYAQQAEIFQKMGDNPRAEEALLQARLIANRLNIKPLLQNIGEIYLFQSDIYMKMKKYEKSEIMLNEALSISDKIQDKKLEQKICKMLIILYSIKNDKANEKIFRKREKNIYQELKKIKQ